MAEGMFFLTTVGGHCFVQDACMPSGLRSQSGSSKSTVGLLASAQALQLCTMLNPSDSWAHVQKQQGTNAAAGSQAELPNGHPPPVDTYAQLLQLSPQPALSLLSCLLEHQSLHRLHGGAPVSADSTY